VTEYCFVNNTSQFPKEVWSQPARKNCKPILRTFQIEGFVWGKLYHYSKVILALIVQNHLAYLKI